MQEELDIEYEKYLNDTLKLIFDTNTTKEIPKRLTKWVDVKKVEERPKKEQDISRHPIKKNEYGEKCLVDDDGNKISDYYDNIDDLFYDGFAIVKKGKKINYINESGQLLSDEWFDSLPNHFSEGIVCVCKEEMVDNFGLFGVAYRYVGRYYYINKEGRYLNHDYFDSADDFEEGTALVKKNDKYFFIDKRGYPINSHRYDSVGYFEGKYAHVSKGYNYKNKGSLSNFVDRKGNPKFSFWFTIENEDDNKYIIIKSEDGWNIIDPNLDIKFPWLNRIDTLKNEVYSLEDKNGKHNYFFSRSNELLSKKWYDEIITFKDFKDNFIIVRDNGKYAFLDIETGDIVDDKWYQRIECYDDKYCVVKDNDKYNMVGKDYKPMCDTWYKNMSPAFNMIKVTRDDDKMNFLDETGQLICEEWYDIVENYYNYGAGMVGKKQSKVMKWNLIDKNGNPMMDSWSIMHPSFYLGGNTITIKCGLKRIKIAKEPRDFKDYKITKNGTHYVYSSPNDAIFATKYEPIHIYDRNHIVCRDNKIIYLYDVDKGEERALCAYTEDNIRFFTKHFIVYDDKRYLMYNNKMIDVTDYYNKHNLDETPYRIIEGVDLMSKEEFYLKNEGKIKDSFMTKLREIEEKEKQDNIEEELRKAEEFIKEHELTEEELLKIKDDSTQVLLSTISRLDDCEKRLGKVKKERFTLPNLLIDRGNHKELNPLCFTIGVDRIEFKNMPFRKVRLRGLDLHDANFTIGENDLQEVENMDLTDTNLEGQYLLPRTKLEGVIINGARFSIDNNEKTMDISLDAFKKAIYDDKTTINGVPLVELLEKERRHSR